MGCDYAAVAPINQVLSAVVDVNVDSSVTVGPLVTLNSGTARTSGLQVSVAPVLADRFAVQYQDTIGQPVIQDGGVFGNSIVMGR